MIKIYIYLFTTILAIINFLIGLFTLNFLFINLFFVFGILSFIALCYIFINH